MELQNSMGRAGITLTNHSARRLLWDVDQGRKRAWNGKEPQGNQMLEVTVDNGKEKLQQFLGCPLVYCDCPRVTLHIKVYLTSGKHKNKNQTSSPVPELSFGWKEALKAALPGSHPPSFKSLETAEGIGAAPCWEVSALTHCFHCSLPSCSFSLKIRRKPSYLPLSEVDSAFRWVLGSQNIPWGWLFPGEAKQAGFPHS